MNRVNRANRRVRHEPFTALLLVLALATLGSCSFFANEFGTLDRAGPVAAGAPDAPVVGTADRP